MLRGLIFDLDGTLADNVQHTCDTLSEACSAYADRTITPAEIWAHFGPSEEGILQQLLPDRWVLAADRYWAQYRERWSRDAGPVDGLQELLGGLHARNLRIGIVTGRGLRGTELTLDLLGIREQLTDWVAGSPTGADKPAGLRHLLAVWGCTPREVAYVGDASADMQAARTVGVIPLGAAWCTTADPEALRAAGAEQVFRTTRELLAWVGSQPHPGRTAVIEE